MRSRLWLTTVLGAALSFATPTAAQPRDAAAAEALFQQGRTAADAGDFATACKKFYESNRLDPAVGTVFNMADCEEKQGRVATAWTLFEEVAQKLADSDERHGIAKARAVALSSRIPRLTVKLEAPPAGARVLRDGVELGAASLDTPLPLDPGAHSIVVEAPGHRREGFDVSLREGEQRTVDVHAGAPTAGADDASTAHGSSHTLGWVFAGLGVAGLGVGTVTGVMVLGKKSTADDNCPNKRCNPDGQDAVDAGRTLGAVSTVGFVVGAVGLAAGAYFLLSGSGDEQQPRTALSLSPTYGGARFGFVHTF